MKTIITILFLIVFVNYGFSQTKSKTVKLINNKENVKNNSQKEIHTKTFTRIPKEKAKKLKIVHPSSNKKLIKRITPEEAAELRKKKQKK